jgi:hypothetical protein
METAEQTEAIPIHPSTRFNVTNSILRNMADVCEASVYSVCSMDYPSKIRVHSWFNKSNLPKE